MSGLVAIHQPNFFPWLGYFDKIRRADIFVLLDAVAYPRAGSGGMGSWCNRVRLDVQGEARWVTCPLRRAPLGTSIATTEIDDTQSWRPKLLRTLEVNYGKAPQFATCMTILEPLISAPESNLAAFNIRAIEAIAAQLRLSTRFIRQSTLSYSGHATELLISLVKAVGGSTYMSGDGAAGYQRDELFAENGLGLVKQNFSPISYGEPSRFIPGLSVIDYLMWDGRPLASGSRS
ncbi:WbqC family protein [Bradyrhizobium jicamae]|uniref:WbqC family protein n=1 Tax=Bradyrhizobium jicamae TaxID=280332 RepID=A0ABS5FWT1_9BRAD|nr:WbqC family protein [Bradyrhizobium jicamae]MBR0801191.1 WbqC family protein [Bradyrhizobium jicamae]